MKLQTRKLIDTYFSGLGIVSILILAAALLVILVPIFYKGIGAFIFKGTVEFRRLNYQQLGRGDPAQLQNEIRQYQKLSKHAYEFLHRFKKQMDDESIPDSHEYGQDFKELKERLHELIGPVPGESQPVLIRDRYGKTRWEQAKKSLEDVLFMEEWDYSDPESMGKKVLSPRQKFYKGTALEGLFPYLENNLEKILQPRVTFYWRFLTDTSFDAHIFGGIGAEVLGTIYLVLGTMLFAVPLGVSAAVYLTEFSRGGKIVALLRVCIGTLAGVPSIVFGLFGLAFFINTVKVSKSKSVLAGSLTLAILVLPTIIRAAEEAIRAVPATYKEAALSLGAGKLRTVLTVILPAALPGILTGIIISMGRAAGETAPIIFTAAVSVGQPLNLAETLSQPTPALPWNIYNLVTEHEAVDQIRHVQFGMVFTLVMMVLLLNIGAIIVRARIAKKLRG
ncbi:MAG: phosphate ABC transporter permease PstA [bacterium]|nr:phosphate ABC transporter permease PstA [bacterium]